MSVTAYRRWKPLERRSGSAFTVAGALILASLVVPVGLEAFTDWSWVAGLALIGFAAVAASAGLFGLYPEIDDRAARLALAGVGAAAVAGLAALGLLALVSVALVGEVVMGRTVGEPMGAFSLLGLSTAGGLSLSLLSFGIASWRTAVPSRSVGALLIAGGAALLAPVVVELFGPAFGVATPAWLLFGAIGAVSVDTLAIGYSLGSREKHG